MTLNITIKEPSKRARGLVLSGAQGQHARNDGRHKRIDLCGRDIPTGRPQLNKKRDIAEQLGEGIDDPEDIEIVGPIKRRSRTRRYVTETPTAPKVRREPKPKPQPHTRDGIRVVVINCNDAWGLVSQRF